MNTGCDWVDKGTWCNTTVPLPDTVPLRPGATIERPSTCPVCERLMTEAAATHRAEQAADRARRHPVPA